MSTANRVIKNTGFLYAKMGITMFISLYTTRLILNALGASDFGIFNIVGGAIAMLGFLDAAMASATQRFMSFSEGEGDKEKQKKIFNISFVLHFGIAIIMGLVLLIAGWFFFNGVLNIAPDRIFAAKVVYGSLIVSTIFTVMTVPYDAVLNAHENMLYYSIVGVLESVLKLGAALSVVYVVGDKLVLYGILMACIPLVTMTIMRIYCHRHYVECLIAPKRYFDRVLMKEMTKFAGWNLIGASSSMIVNYGLGIVLNNFFGTLLNAAQGIANQLSGQLSVFSANLNKAVNPVIVKKEGEGNRKLMLEYSLFSSKMSFFIMGFLIFPVIIKADFLLKFWLGDFPPWSSEFLIIALIRALIDQLSSTLNTSLNAIGKIRSITIFNFIANVSTLIICALIFTFKGSPIWIYLGPLLIICIGSYSNRIYVIHRLTDLSINIYSRQLLLPLFVVSLITIVIDSVLSSVFSSYAIGSVMLFFLISIFVFVLLFITIGLTKSERSVIKNLIAKNR